MEQIWPVQMPRIYEWYGLKKGGMSGGDFNGPSLKTLIKPFMLTELEKHLGEGSKPWLDYLDSVRELHQLCVQKEVPDVTTSEFIIGNFIQAFEEVHLLGCPETLKVHVASCHIMEFIKENQETLHDYLDECVEAMHQLWMRREYRHKFKMTKDLTSDLKKKRSLKSITYNNSLNKKFKT